MPLLMQSLVRKSQDTSAIVCIATVRKSARLDDTYFNDLLALDILAARDRLEDETECALLTSQYTQSMDSWPEKILSLVRWPLQSLDAVRVRRGGAMVPVSLNQFDVHKDDHHHAMVRPIGSFPSHDGLIEIDFTAGYLSADVVPAKWKKLLIATSVHYLQNPDQFDDLPAGLRAAIRSASCYTPW